MKKKSIQYSLQVEKLQITRKLSDIVRAVGIRQENQHCFQICDTQSAQNGFKQVEMPYLAVTSHLVKPIYTLTSQSH